MPGLFSFYHGSSMNFYDIVQEVIGLTGRKEQIRSIKRHVNNCCRKIGRSGEYSLALSEITYSGPYSETTNNLTVPKDYKATLYVRDDPNLQPLPRISIGRLVSPDPQDEVLCGWYQSGDRIIVRSVAVPQALYVGWYLYPSYLVQDGDSNWVTEHAFDLLIDFATAMTLTVLGDIASADRLKAYTNEEIQKAILNLLRL